MLSEVVTTTAGPMEIPLRMTYLGIDKKDDLNTQITIPPLHTNISMVAAENFKIEEVILGKPTKDTMQVLATLGIKQLFTQIEKCEKYIQILRR